jgi:hypothetical protein
MTGKTKRAMCVNDAHTGVHEKKEKGLKKDRKVPAAVTQHTAYITEAPPGAQRTISLCSVYADVKEFFPLTIAASFLALYFLLGKPGPEPS